MWWQKKPGKRQQVATISLHEQAAPPRVELRVLLPKFMMTCLFGPEFLMSPPYVFSVAAARFIRARHRGTDGPRKVCEFTRNLGVAHEEVAGTSRYDSVVPLRAADLTPSLMLWDGEGVSLARNAVEGLSGTSSA